jgi:hypothetical protein
MMKRRGVPPRCGKLLEGLTSGDRDGFKLGTAGFL